MSLKLLPLIISPTGIHNATVIFLHGFGSTREDWQILSTYFPSLHSSVKWIFPQAPNRKISVYNNELVPAWHDIRQSDHTKRLSDNDEDEVGMKESLSMLEELIRKEKVEHKIDSKRIIVGGFSQGAGMALLEGVLGESTIGGIAVLSGYVPLKYKITDMKNKDANSLPVFWAHGTADAVIKYQVGKSAYEQMEASGMKNISFHSYSGMGHSYCEEELNDFNVWLDERLVNQVGSHGAPKICEDTSSWSN